jgi:quinol monooxygenase YgiN
MTVRLGLLATLEAQQGKGEELAAFLQDGLALAQAEKLTINWYAFRLSETTFGIFDTFEGEEGRQAHLGGEIAAALGKVAPDLLATAPDIRPADLIAVK